MLARDRPPDRDAMRHDLAPGLMRLVYLLWIANVEKNARVQVAVAGVEDVADAQSVFLGNAIDEPQHRRNLRARDNAILCVIRRRESAERREGILAALPQKQAFLLRRRAPDFAGLHLHADLPDGFCLLGGNFAQS